MMKSIGCTIFGIVIGAIVSYLFFSYQLAERSLVEFTNGMESESAAMSKVLAELATLNEEPGLTEKLLTISCIASSGFLEEVNEYDLDFEGIYLAKEDAEIAHRIAKENGIEGCSEQ